MEKIRNHWKKCPNCGSKHFATGRTFDVTYYHHPGRKIERVTSSDYPLTFQCMDCNYNEIQGG